MTSPQRSLKATDREFLAQVRETIYLNPFTVSERVLARWQDLSQSRQPEVGHLLAPVGRVVDVFFRELDGIAPLNLREFSAEDAELLSHSMLFQIYHRYVDAMDRHIQEQLNRPERTLVVTYAQAMLSDLHQRGFGSERAVRYLAIFYQMRRAFYFIDLALVGSGSLMRELRSLLWTAVFSNDARRYDRFLWNRMEDFSILLLGPTGSGKGAAAGAVGRSAFIPYDESRKRFADNFAGNLVQANLSEFSENLIESELFGHRKGAFTGAVDKHEGLFQRCSTHGCLFLDEMAELEPPNQLKLLRVLQDREFTAVGSHDPLRFQGRLMTATHRNLDELRARGEFRDDLYYRLSALVIQVPSLHQRVAESAEELPKMIRLLVSRSIGRDMPEIADEVAAELARQVPENYPWPGNVRELEQAVRRSLLSLPFKPNQPPLDGGGDDISDLLMAGQPTVKTLLADYCGALYSRYGSYEEVARRTGLDRRTVKKHLND